MRLESSLSCREDSMPHFLNLELVRTPGCAASSFSLNISESIVTDVRDIPFIAQRVILVSILQPSAASNMKEITVNCFSICLSLKVPPSGNWKLPVPFAGT